MIGVFARSVELISEALSRVYDPRVKFGNITVGSMPSRIFILPDDRVVHPDH